MENARLIELLNDYKSCMTDILKNFDADYNMHDSDITKFKQYVIELIDLLNEAFGENNSYSINVINQYNEGISNFYSSPSHFSVESILVIIEAVITKINRNPNLIENNSNATQEFSEKFPETVTLSWLFKHVPVKIWISLIVFIVTVFTFGIKVGQTNFIQSLFNNSTGQISNSNILKEQINSLTQSHNETIKKINDAVISEEKSAASSMFNDDKIKHQKAAKQLRNMIKSEDLRFQEEIINIKKQFE